MDNGFPNGWGRVINRDGSYFIGKFRFSPTNDGKKYDKDGKIVISFDSEEDLDNIIDTTWESLNKIQNELE